MRQEHEHCTHAGAEAGISILQLPAMGELLKGLRSSAAMAYVPALPVMYAIGRTLAHREPGTFQCRLLLGFVEYRVAKMRRVWSSV